MNCKQLCHVAVVDCEQRRIRRELEKKCECAAAIERPTYAGNRTLRAAFVTVRRGKVETALDLLRSLRVRKHSPTGFEWGYCGSGPAQLALAILLDYFPAGSESTIENLYQDFKADVIATLPEKSWIITSGEIAAWLTRKWGEKP